MKKIDDVRRWAEFLDVGIRVPLLGYVGWDAIIGLIPGFGDTLTLFASLYIVFRAFQVGCRWPALLKMLLNVLLDVLIGSVPVVGDFLDIYWRANLKNLALIEEELEWQVRSR